MDKYIIPNLRNACRVLKLLSKSSVPVSTKTITEDLELPRTTAMRILSTLSSEGFCQKKEGGFTLGPALIGVAAAARASMDLGDLSLPYLRALTDLTGETSHLAIPSDNRSLILEVNVSPHPLASSRGPGSLVDLHCSATGKCFLTYIYSDALESVLSPKSLNRHTENTITTMKAMRREISCIRDQGYATDEQEFFEGVRCMAAPVFDSENRCVAAIGITASTTRFTTDHKEAFSILIKEKAAALSATLGWNGEAPAAQPSSANQTQSKPFLASR